MSGGILYPTPAPCPSHGTGDVHFHPLDVIWPLEPSVMTDFVPFHVHLGLEAPAHVSLSTWLKAEPLIPGER